MANNGFVPYADLKPVVETVTVTLTAGQYTNKAGQTTEKLLVEGMPAGFTFTQNGQVYVDPNRNRGSDMMFSLKDDSYPEV